MEDKQNNTAERNNTNILLWGVIALLVAAGTYFFITKNSAIEEKDTAEIRLEEVNIQKDQLNREYDAAVVRLDQLKTDNTAKDDEIARQESELGKLRGEIESILKDKNTTVAELMKARSLITALESMTTKYQKQIGALKQENIQLVDDKRNLTEEKRVVTQEKEGLQIEKRGLEKDNKQLEEKVDLGQVLSATNIEMKVINKKKNIFGKERDKATTKARRADLLEINFDLGVNRIIESGEKTVHISVIDPSGNVIHATGNGAGKIDLAEGGSKDFTTKKVIPYSQGKNAYGIKTACVPTDNFSAGNYKVELYHKGHLIGKDNITLK